MTSRSYKQSRYDADEGEKNGMVVLGALVVIFVLGVTLIVSGLVG